MFLFITVWVEESNVDDLSSVYFSLNRNEKIRRIVPKMIINRKDLKSDKNYVEFQLPYKLFIELKNLNKTKEMIKDTNVVDDMEVVKNALDDAAEHNLESEIVYLALKSIKENPNLSIKEAISNGYHKWLK